MRCLRRASRSIGGMVSSPDEEERESSRSSALARATMLPTRCHRCRIGGEPADGGRLWIGVVTLGSAGDVGEVGVATVPGRAWGVVRARQRASLTAYEPISDRAHNGTRWLDYLHPSRGGIQTQPGELPPRSMSPVRPLDRSRSLGFMEADPLLWSLRIVSNVFGLFSLLSLGDVCHGCRSGSPGSYQGGGA